MVYSNFIQYYFCKIFSFQVKEENSGGSNYDNDRAARQPANRLDTIIQPPPSPRQEMKYSGLEAAAAKRKQREAGEPGRDSLKSRYSSDPCKVLSPLNNPPFKGPITEEYLPPAPPTPIAGQGGNNTSSNENVFFGEDSGPTVGYKPQAKQQLPVDEDDYLQPQSSQHLPKYLDVVQDGK